MPKLTFTSKIYLFLEMAKVDDLDLKLLSELKKDGSINLMKRIKHRDLTHYFIREHSTLPAGYLRSCEKFFKNLKQQAASGKLQAPSFKLDT